LVDSFERVKMHGPTNPKNTPKITENVSRIYLELKLMCILLLLFDELMLPMPECHNS